MFTYTCSHPVTLATTGIRNYGNSTSNWEAMSKTIAATAMSLLD